MHCADYLFYSIICNTTIMLPLTYVVYVTEMKWRQNVEVYWGRQQFLKAFSNKIFFFFRFKKGMI